MGEMMIGEVCRRIQEIQDVTFRMRDLFHSSSSQFHALTVAWEALRFAWYVVHGDLSDADAKLERVNAAIEWYQSTRGKEL